MPRWGEEESYKFVTLYRAHECLWNVIHPSYKSRQKRNEAFKRIADEINVPNFSAADVPKKIKNLRSTYYQVLAKIERSTETDKLYTPSVKWFHDMDYVLKNSNNVERPVMSNMDALEPEVKYCYITAENGDGTADEFGADSQATYQNLLPVAAYVPPLAQSRSRKRPYLQSISASVEDLTGSNKSITSAGDSSGINVSMEEDECDIIGKHVTMQLKKLHPDDIVDANLEIQQLLAKYRKKQTQSVAVDSSVPQQKMILWKNSPSIQQPDL